MHVGRIDRQGRGQARQDRGERLLQLQTHRILVDLLDRFEQAETRFLEAELARWIHDEIDRIDHVVGIEIRTVLEFDALAQFEFDRLVVDESPRFRQPRQDLAFVGIILNERIEDRARDQIGLRLRIIDRIDDRDRLIDADAQCVLGLLRQGRQRRQANSQRDKTQTEK